MMSTASCNADVNIYTVSTPRKWVTDKEHDKGEVSAALAPSSPFSSACIRLYGRYKAILADWCFNRTQQVATHQTHEYWVYTCQLFKVSLRFSSNSNTTIRQSSYTRSYRCLRVTALPLSPSPPPYTSHQLLPKCSTGHGRITDSFAWPILLIGIPLLPFVGTRHTRVK